jgi:transcriptional regulator with XRE-family HTH domain
MSTKSNKNAPPAWHESASVRFGKRLRVLREERGLVQMQLSMAADLSRTFVSDLERGFKEPALGTQEKLAEVFSMSISELMKGV